MAAPAMFFAFVPFAGGIIGAIGVIALAGLANGPINVLYITLVQRVMPRPLLGRIMGAFLFANLGLYPLSVALAGIITTHLGPAVIFPLAGIPACIAVVFRLWQRELREL